MSIARKAVLGVFGSLFVLVAGGLLVAGAAVIWAMGTRTTEGFVTNETASASTDTYALTSTQLDLGGLRNDWLPANWLATIQVTASPRGDSPVFIGIGPSQGVAEFLERVEHDEVALVSDDDVTYVRHDGSVVPSLPGDADLWVASDEGTGPQSLAWDIEPGQWTLVIMNSDASPEVAVDVSAGARTPWLAVAIAGLLVGGLLCGAVGAVMLVFAFRRPATGRPSGFVTADPPMASVSGTSEHDPD